MTTTLLWIAVVLAAAVLALMARIVVHRLRTDRRRERERVLRAEIEDRIAAYVVDDRADPPVLPASPEAREVIRLVAIEVLAEVRGAERDRLIRLLERSGIVAETAQRLRSRRSRARGEAAEALSYMSSPLAAPELLACLGDTRVENRLGCAAALAELGDPGLNGPILAVADELAAGRPGPVAAILVTLGRREPAALAQALAPNASSELRRLAAAVVGQLRLSQHASRLMALARESDPELVARAVRGLGLIGDVRAVDVAIELLSDDRSPAFVRLAAAGALGALGDVRGVPALRRQLAADSWPLQARAADSLRMLGDAGRLGLESGLSSPRESTRELVQAALGA